MVREPGIGAGKKLEEAAVRWASGGPTSVDAFGIPGQAEEDYEVWPENWDTVRAFSAMSTQWRIIAGMGGASWLGLEYAAIPATLRLLGMPRDRWQDVFAGMRVMERAALSVLNQKRG